ncbi:MAG TPA: lactate utilization protein [Bryobacteraceae bacterium]
MSARDSILAQVRAALGRSGPGPAEPAPSVRLRAPESGVEARIESLFCAAGMLAGKTFLAASPAHARQYVAEVIGGKPSVASNASLLHTCGIDSLDSVQTGFTGEGALRSACASAAFGITGADYALADTGTLVMLSSPEEARMISLLPPVHVALVSRDRILTGLDELFSILPRPGDVTSSMVLITGPSRTADIEQILVRGVHGPGEIHVVVV